MKKSHIRVLFTLGLHQTDKPERWASKHKVYCYLSRSLNKLGIDSLFLCNKLSVKPKFIDDDTKYYYQDDTPISELVNKHGITHVFIWGGRTLADDKLRLEVGGRAKIIYSEAGWFPQSNTCYFSPFGTNASSSFMDEGLSEHLLCRSAFRKDRQKIIRSTLGFWASLNALDFYSARTFDTSKPIFLPLQDENDTNIILSSPVKSMTEFITTFATKYADVKFVVRPHPRASYNTLPAFDNIEYQSIQDNPYTRYKEYGGVIGINSTMLLQYSLLGLPVAGVGFGVGTGNNAYLDLDYSNLPESINGMSFDSELAARFYDYLIRIKQTEVQSLLDHRFVEKSYIYSLINSEK